jgi:hypothetical protein
MHAAFSCIQAAKATCARKVEERKAELSSRKQQLADVLQVGEAPAAAEGAVARRRICRAPQQRRWASGRGRATLCVWAR